ncbi:MAG TPA: papain-like cysteine protease family protein, partial [Candidatus Paceibacterota bacterium]|nr:papain-like cysteine protease family protein [Candidatus Paceibacterota bacterium]
MNPTATKIGSVLLVLSGIIGGALFFYGLPQDPITHTIEGVPYYGLYTQKGEASKFNHEVDASLASILEYWNPDTLDFGAFADDLFVELEGLTRDERANYTLDQIGYSLENLANFISRDGLYTARVEGLSLRDAAKYIERDVPLYTYASLTNDAPLAYASPYVLIGIDEVEKRLTLHNYWFGNNLELTFDEFNNLIGAENST